MPDPVSFDSKSPRFGLPFLFAGQAQREVYINESLVLIDALLHCAIEGVSDTPPATPEDGQAWLIGEAPGGAWQGFSGHLACYQAGQWILVAPRDGMRVQNRATGKQIRHHAGWISAVEPTAPDGGPTIDAEARSAIAELVAALRAHGVFDTA